MVAGSVVKMVTWQEIALFQIFAGSFFETTVGHVYFLCPW